MKLRIGDTVKYKNNELSDGTVVDVIDNGDAIQPQYVRVYWRYPLGKVKDCYASELTLRTYQRCRTVG